MLFADDSEIDHGGGTIEDLQELDDVIGSGIFDEPGTVTQNPDMGVFESSPALPGYIARHPPFALNTEIQRGGRPSMEVPGGGVALVTFVDRPAPVPMQYPVLPTFPLYPGGPPHPVRHMPPGPHNPRPQPPPTSPQQVVWSSRKVNIAGVGDDAATAPAPGSSLMPIVAGGALVGVALAIFLHASTGMDNRPASMRAVSRGRR